MCAVVRYIRLHSILFYVQISGHEIVGKVTIIGENVKNCNVGDIVGVGWQLMVVDGVCW